MKALVGAFNQEKALVGAFSVIVQPVVEPMEHYTALIYILALQVSQYTFAICSYKEKKSEPSEMLQMDGYTVDYIEPAGGEP